MCRGIGSAPPWSARRGPPALLQKGARRHGGDDARAGRRPGVLPIFLDFYAPHATAAALPRHRRASLGRVRGRGRGCGWRVCTKPSLEGLKGPGTLITDLAIGKSRFCGARRRGHAAGCAKPDQRRCRGRDRRRPGGGRRRFRGAIRSRYRYPRARSGILRRGELRAAFRSGRRPS